MNQPVHTNFARMKDAGGYRIKLILAGIAFAILWASASAATKIGLQPAQAFVIAVSSACCFLLQ